MHCRDATYGSCIKVNGTLMASDHDKQPVEVRADSIEVIGSCDYMVSSHDSAVHCSSFYTFKNYLIVTNNDYFYHFSPFAISE